MTSINRVRERRALGQPAVTYLIHTHSEVNPMRARGPPETRRRKEKKMISYNM